MTSWAKAEDMGCCVSCNPINLCSIQWLSCSMPNTPIIPSTTCQCRGERKTEQQEIVHREHKQLQMRTLMFFCSKGLVWVPPCLRERQCIWILNRRERKYCVVKGLLPGKQTSNVSVSLCDNVPPRGGIVGLLRTETLITQELLTWFWQEVLYLKRCDLK